MSENELENFKKNLKEMIISAVLDDNDLAENLGEKLDEHSDSDEFISEIIDKTVEGILFNRRFRTKLRAEIHEIIEKLTNDLESTEIKDLQAELDRLRKEVVDLRALFKMNWRKEGETK